MVSLTKLRANRLNARKSTGPRTPQGKARSSRNALKHGLSARRPPADDEQAARYRAFRDRVRRQLKPGCLISDLYCDRIALAAWRLGRVRELEAAMLRCAPLRRHEWLDEEELAAACEATAAPGAAPDEGGAGGDGDGEEARAARAALPSRGELAAYECLTNGDYEKLRRYETHLERSLMRALRELQFADAGSMYHASGEMDYTWLGRLERRLH